MPAVSYCLLAWYCCLFTRPLPSNGCFSICAILAVRLHVAIWTLVYCAYSTKESMEYSYWLFGVVRWGRTDGSVSVTEMIMALVHLKIQFRWMLKAYVGILFNLTTRLHCFSGIVTLILLQWTNYFLRKFDQRVYLLPENPLSWHVWYLCLWNTY
jgi:hypothetical protein